MLFDALAIPGGKGAVKVLDNLGQAEEFIKEQYRHAKAILALGAAADLVENAGVPSVLPTGAPDPGVLIGRNAGAGELLSAFVVAVGKRRHHEREMDPPEV